MDSEALDIMFICSMVDYCVHAYIEAVRYVFIPKICFFVLVVQIADSCCVVKIKNDIFLQDLIGFYQRKGHICYCYRMTEFISRKLAFNASDYFLHSLMRRYVAGMTN